MGPTKPGGARTCPHCSERFAITVDPKMAALGVLIGAGGGFFLLRPIPVVGPALWGFVTVVLTFVLAARLKKATS